MKALLVKRDTDTQLMVSIDSDLFTWHMMHNGIDLHQIVTCARDTEIIDHKPRPNRRVLAHWEGFNKNVRPV